MDIMGFEDKTEARTLELGSSYDDEVTVWTLVRCLQHSHWLPYTTRTLQRYIGESASIDLWGSLQSSDFMVLRWIISWAQGSFLALRASYSKVTALVFQSWLGILPRGFLPKSFTEKLFARGFKKKKSAGLVPLARLLCIWLRCSRKREALSCSTIHKGQDNCRTLLLKRILQIL